MEDTVPPEHTLALALWQCHHLALHGLSGDHDANWWTLPSAVRLRWIETARQFTQFFEVQRRWE